MAEGEVMPHHTSPTSGTKTNHRQLLGYHSLLLVALLIPTDTSEDLARSVIIAEINQARQAEQLSPLLPDPLLDLVGNAFCQKVLLEGRRGHFANDGVPPYLRYFLPGGRGFHRQNVGSYQTTGTIDLGTLPTRALELTRAMLAEQPPEDGHRRTLLDPLATHIGIGIAYAPHRLVISHEVAVRRAVLDPSEPFCRPGGSLRWSGRLPRPWRVAAVEVLWEPLPGTYPAPTSGSYSYPPRKAWYSPWEFLPQTLVSLPSSLSLVRGGRFTFTQRAGEDEGVELLVLWAGKVGETTLYPLALGGCVVVRGSPPESLRFWHNLTQRSEP